MLVVMKRYARGKASGTTLIELMVAVAIISIAILGFVGAFKYISKSLHVSRTRTLAANLTGTVNAATPPSGPGGALASAIVTLEGVPNAQTTADVNGSYSFHVYHGSYTVRVSSAGYWDAESNRMSAVEGTNTTVNP